MHLQEISTRLAGRLDPSTTSFGSATNLESALRRAATAHGEHERHSGQRDENWPRWYAEYMVAAARKPISEAHNRQETPLFAKSIEAPRLKEQVVFSDA